MYKVETNAGCAFGAVILAVIATLVISMGGCMMYNAKTDTVTVTVTDKESVNLGKQGHEYRVYTDGEVFINQDSLWHGKWTSADIQGRLEPGKTYRMNVCGWRWGFFSHFRNILSIQELKE